MPRSFIYSYHLYLSSTLEYVSNIFKFSYLVKFVNCHVFESNVHNSPQVSDIKCCVFVGLLVGADENKDVNTTLLYASVAAAAADLGLVIISYTLSHHSLRVTSFFTLLVGVLPSYIIFHFGVSAR